ncbi:MAG: hypothetical protein VX278_02975 [Myxococcota bacterium]|nr:hypothetical protein [Myxococcota bacterium]
MRVPKIMFKSKPFKASLPSGFLHIDQTIGGYPTGDLVEVTGKDHVGKTDLALRATLSNDMMGFPSLYLDTNHQLGYRSREIQKCTSSALVSHVRSAEQIISLVRATCTHLPLRLVVIDSLDPLIEREIPPLYSVLRELVVRNRICLLLLHAKGNITPQRIIRCSTRLQMEANALRVAQNQQRWTISNAREKEDRWLFRSALHESLIRPFNNTFVFDTHFLGLTETDCIDFLGRNPHVFQKIYHALYRA